MGLIATSDHGLAGSLQKNGRAVLSLVSFLTPIISHCGISVFILLRALTMSQLLNVNGHPVSVQYDLLLQESHVSRFAAACLGVSISCPQVLISVPALPSRKLPSIFTSVVDVTIDDSLICEVVLGMNWVGLCRAAMMGGLVEFLDSSPESSCRSSGPQPNGVLLTARNITQNTYRLFSLQQPTSHVPSVHL